MKHDEHTQKEQEYKKLEIQQSVSGRNLGLAKKPSHTLWGPALKRESMSFINYCRFNPEAGLSSRFKTAGTPLA